MTTTPPARQTALTPPTPLHGPLYDESPRRSSRISTRHLSSPRHSTPPATLHKRATRPVSSHALSPPSSPVSPNQRSKLSNARRSRTDNGVTDQSEPASTLARKRDLDLAGLPTPAKTPRKRVAKPNVGSTARILFQDRHPDPNEVMPSPRRARHGKKHAAFSLDSFDNQQTEGDGIEIYTDTKERMPDADDSDENPFFIKRGARRTTKPNDHAKNTRRSSRTKHGMTKEIDEAVENGEGLVYVFRGKKIFRKFTDTERSPEEEADDGGVGALSDQETLRRSAGSSSRSRFTRSSIKPRLLFPPQEPVEPVPADDEDDEEAVTDIEGMQVEGDEQPRSSSAEQRVITPVKERYRPMTPPTTTRKKKSSTFDSWQRTKRAEEGERVATGKRQGQDLEPLGRSPGAAKRSRNSGVFSD